MKLRSSPLQYQQERLAETLRRIFGEFNHQILATLMPLLEWVELEGGESLFQQGDAGEDLYFVVSGRLRAHVAGQGGRRVIGEIMRGETVGEMAVIAGETRSATVTAIRDSVLVRLSRETFEEVIKAYPPVAMNITRLIIERLKRTSNLRHAGKRPVNICVVPITPGVDAGDFCRRLAPHLSKTGAAMVVDSEMANAENDPGGVPSSEDAGSRSRTLSHWLDEIESSHEFLLFVADPHPSEWTRRCTRDADEILLLANARLPPDVHQIEESLLTRVTETSAVTQRLVLLHEPDARLPSGTAVWLDRRPVSGHIHIRPALEKDLARLARTLSGTAIGLVLSGGGARGFAHLGVYQALEEYGIPVDRVGGTSIGAVMAAFVAFDLPAAEMIDNARRAFATNPTSDFNLFPFVSLFGGRKLKLVIDGAVRESVGFDADIADAWKNYFCVASNFSRASEEVLTRGAIAKAIRASVSIPAALPPVIHNGDLLLDGGTFNNFPTDVMARRGLGRIIGVDLTLERFGKVPMEEVPGMWELLRDRLRGRARRRYHLPSPIGTLLQFSLLTSVSRQQQSRESTDLYFNPDLGRVGMVEWGAFDRIVRMGYDHARRVLDAMPAGELATYRG